MQSYGGKGKTTLKFGGPYWGGAQTITLVTEREDLILTIGVRSKF